MFIITVEILARGVNNLHKDKDFKGYNLPKWSPAINHLSYADDTILFYSGDMKSVLKMMRMLKDYKKVSGHLISMYIHEKIALAVGARLTTIGLA